MSIMLDTERVGSGLLVGWEFRFGLPDLGELSKFFLSRMR